MYNEAKQMYASIGVDVEQALTVLAETPISLHCWQGDDVVGFEEGAGALGSGLAVTGSRVFGSVAGSLVQVAPVPCTIVP